MKRNVIILNMRYLDYDGKDITIGGVQTYISNLSKVIIEMGKTVEVFQFANKDFYVRFNDLTVRGVKVNHKASLQKKSKMLFEKCREIYDERNDIIIFATDLIIPKNANTDAIAIQHGIGWDIESEYPCSRFENVVQSIRQCRRGLITTKHAKNVNMMVCVDYNYINWYRTQIKHSEMKYYVIPNFSKIPSENLEKFSSCDPIRIIFARRMVKYRGTRLFARVIHRLLEQHDNIEVTFAGDGPEEVYLKTLFAEYNNVHFTTYASDESLYIHKDKHIAVIPTIGSEGTSLSLLEAMASSCAVICTNVGGMTNIVIDNLNGKIINPDEEQLYCSLKEMIDDKDLQKRLAHEAYRTVQYGFSLDEWKQKWKKVLLECE